MTRKTRLGVVGAVVLAAAGTWLVVSQLRGEEGLEGFGTIEARNIRVGSKIGGRIVEVHVREGDRVEPGDLLVKFDEQELLAALEQARANVAKLERGYRPEEIAQARAAAGQAKADYELRRNGSRQEDIEAARAEVARTRADAERARRDFLRADELARSAVFSTQQRDNAEAAWRMAEAAQQAAEQRLAELERGFRPEEIAAAEAAYEQAQANLEMLERGYRAEDIAFARGQLLEAEARYREREVWAPAAATVEVLDIRPGDLIAPNTPIALLLERDQIYVRIYVPETEIGGVRLGQRAEVRVDAYPDGVFPAVVEQINQQAEFLPRNVQTREERVHQVIGVKLRIADPEARLRPGIAAEVHLLPPEGAE